MNIRRIKKQETNKQTKTKRRKREKNNVGLV